MRGCDLVVSSYSLVAPAILLKVELGGTRRRSDWRRPNHIAIPYYVPWLPRDELTRPASKRFSVCLDMPSHAGGQGTKVARFRGELRSVLDGYPDAQLRAVDASRLSRPLLCGTRRRMRQCRFCLVPRGITPSSRRLYEALAAKCVPVVVSDRFVVPYAGSLGAVGDTQGAASSARSGGGGDGGSGGAGGGAGSDWQHRLKHKLRAAAPDHRCS